MIGMKETFGMSHLCHTIVAMLEGNALITTVCINLSTLDMSAVLNADQTGNSNYNNGRVKDWIVLML